MNILKRLYIWFWWIFIIKKYEFHSSLESFVIIDAEKLIARRQIAHLLDQGWSIWDLPDELVKKF